MITIKRINWNGEIWRKLLNSVAAKYDCGVRFIHRGGHMDVEGDRDCAEEIVKEVVALLKP
ncbi:MAG TPA: hypothetical protein VLT88_09070 [Desulfosarcina sp.]|nr:hypothetical protein [Desulfosarcina sp.]